MKQEQFLYKLDVFEGPLDLLLHLIEKHKLNIYDIQISELLDQYMEQINIMQEQDLDIAGEFLSMASRLVQIKSAMLLPKYDEGEKMREELSGQLIEYQRCKKMAKLLSDNISFDSFCREPLKIKADMKYKRIHLPNSLIGSYMAAVGRGKAKLPPSKDVFSDIVARRVVSVSSKIIGVMRKLMKHESIRYENIFDGSTDKSELVATFLAILELIKGKRVRMEEDDGEPVRIMNVGGGENWTKED